MSATLSTFCKKQGRNLRRLTEQISNYTDALGMHHRQLFFFFVRLMRQCSCATIHLYCTPEAGMFHWYPPWREWNMPQTCPTAWLLSLLCLSRIHEEMLWPPPLGDQKLVTDDSVILPWGRVWRGALGSLLYKIIDRIFFYITV